jgi:hypothetical protein
MTSTEYTTDRPCAFCGLGEPSPSKSHGICELCASHITVSDELQLVQDAELKRKIVLISVESKNIMRAGWRNADGKTGVLVVQFRGAGKAFRYINVTRQWWEAFWRAESKGNFFHQTVRADPAAFPFTPIN